MSRFNSTFKEHNGSTLVWGGPGACPPRREQKTARAASIVAATALGFALTGPAPAAEPLLTEQRVLVMVYNFGNVPDHVVAEAKSYTAKVFSPVGVNIEWSEPLMDSRGNTSRQNLGRSAFVIRIVPDSMIPAWAQAPHLLGFSVILKKGYLSFLGGVYCQRIKLLARQLESSEAVILGHVMAHELGHLLLGANSHSQTGIMSTWTKRKEAKLAAQGLLKFSRSQALRIRTNLQERVAVERVAR